MKLISDQVKKVAKKEFQLKLKGKTAVFIDAANIERSLADLGVKVSELRETQKGFSGTIFPKGYWKVDYKKLIKFFKQSGQLVSMSFYSARFDTQSHDQFLAFLKLNGYRLVTKPIKKIRTVDGNSHKANFDVEISVDAVSWLRNYDTFVLFSGDSDFSYLLQLLKKKGKETIVVSQRGHVSKELIKTSDLYIDIFKLREYILRTKKQKSRH